MKQAFEHFEIGPLDHVAIRVKDIEVSATWYQKVLGLKKKQVSVWGDFPVFMLSGKTAVALFPEDKNETLGVSQIDHFAFRVTREDFAKAQIKYQQLGLDFNFQDHHYFHSIYTKDPDGHIVELTTPIEKAGSFYE